MTDKDNTNPLFDSQREKAGAKTIDKYLYQYHWALYRVISEHDTTNEYAVFIELHEDVVISDSLSSQNAKFEFNQVKTNSAKFTNYQLVEKKKSGRSVLGKLIESVNSKPYADKITSLNLVCTSNFSLELKKDDVELKIIRKEDLADSQLKKLEAAIKNELSISELPSTLKFIVPDLAEKDYQKILVGEISSLINRLYPESRFNDESIYRLLIDELIRKGKVTYDFTKWDELIKNKALTSEKVTSVINEFTNIKDEAQLDVEFNRICTEIGLNSIKSKLLKRSFLRYKRQRISNSSSFQHDTTTILQRRIEEAIASGQSDFKELITQVSTNLPAKIRRQFSSQDEITSAIICEYIMMM
ncbi:DUF4297 domain-containing protein [Aequorivita sp. KMM 9714]|uniref:DUF4297 domain-containing protein n=1 Tax=Aequorivita sp. KMM 9714 TaxID=2707173 RepID=UPI0013EA6AC5|nr:DUF4297 domain-containing protein [Aequorivita sp. KMM 9714]NGX84308.1 DUF4297 domain-containing protein [Aequorivita sp. KMM 9714]